MIFFQEVGKGSPHENMDVIKSHTIHDWIQANLNSDEAETTSNTSPTQQNCNPPNLKPTAIN